ncbi:MAG: DNA-directed RNA polymerase [Nanoarchaeota archaeon]|nr:DNA-directed RNA polymerase [Nanoarchaeota archaeon]MBU0977157.1 DNA-directed RNA polymerase [Nanoarchaeota archaeon]
MGYEGGSRGGGGFRGGGGPHRGGGGGRGGFGGRRDFGPREMHKAVCDECKKECEVPFKPTEGKPVYCKECYAKHKKF